MRPALLILALVALTGCHPDVDITVEDNGPDDHEREEAWENCTGFHHSLSADGEYWDRIPQDVRIACTEAIYGG